MKTEIRIRRAWPMPFDRNGVHATGREYLEYVNGIPCWFAEYEDSPTVDLPTTDEDYDYEMEDEE